MNIDRFSWRSYDLRTLLPMHWQSSILAVAEHAVGKTLLPRSVTSREGDPNLKIPVLTVNGTVVREQLPWLYDLYGTWFLEFAQSCTPEPVSIAQNELYGATLNVQRGREMRYECHVDSNPVEGLLYVTDHPPGTGGELVVANNPDAGTVKEVDADASIVYPRAGNLIFFDARRFPHYVRPLVSHVGVRVVVAMNYYTPSCPETARPADLSDHLFGYDRELDEQV